MTDVAEIAQNGGASIAMASAAAGYANATMGWLNHNSAGILALCGIGGFIISIIGHRAKRRHMATLVANELRMKQRRGR